MFQTHQADNLIYLRSDALGDGIRHGFSTRKGGVSVGALESLNLRGYIHGDRKENVEENYRRFCAALGVDVQKVVLTQQEHTDHIRLVTAEDAGKGLWRERDYREIDGLITNVPGMVLTVFGADCSTILLHDPVQHAVGACHAGWRGTANGIAAKTVAAMAAHFGTNPADVRAALGPSIGQCCFETDGDVPEAMRLAFGSEAEAYMEHRGNKWHVDLKGLNAVHLRRAGVKTVDVCSVCTMCHPELYWSHRRMGGQRGVQAAMIALEVAQ